MSSAIFANSAVMHDASKFESSCFRVFVTLFLIARMLWKKGRVSMAKEATVANQREILDDFIPERPGADDEGPQPADSVAGKGCRIKSAVIPHGCGFHVRASTSKYSRRKSLPQAPFVRGERSEILEGRLDRAAV